MCIMYDALTLKYKECEVKDEMSPDRQKNKMRERVTALDRD